MCKIQGQDISIWTLLDC